MLGVRPGLSSAVLRVLLTRLLQAQSLGVLQAEGLARAPRRLARLLQRQEDVLQALENDRVLGKGAQGRLS